MEQSGLEFLVDVHISPKLIRILHKLGESSLRQFSKEFTQETPDEEWIPKATSRGFICITCDRNMLRDEVIAPILSQSNARVIFLGKHFATSKLWDQALWILKYWRKIKKHAETMVPGQLIKVAKNGRITPVIPEFWEP